MIANLEICFNPIAVEDHQAGVLIEALGFLERGYIKQAHALMVALLKDPDLSRPSPKTEAMTRAVNWIDLGLSHFAVRDLEEGLKP